MCWSRTKETGACCVLCAGDVVATVGPRDRMRSGPSDSVSPAVRCTPGRDVSARGGAQDKDRVVTWFGTPIVHATLRSLLLAVYTSFYVYTPLIRHLVLPTTTLRDLRAFELPRVHEEEPPPRQSVHLPTL